MNTFSTFKISEVLSYLRDPYYILPQKNNLKNGINYLIKSYLWCLLLISITTIFLLFLDKIIYFFADKSIYLQVRESMINLKHSFGPYSIIIVAFLGPLLEEVVFRLPLNGTRFGFAAAISVILFRILGNSFTNYNIHNALVNINTIISIAVFFIINSRFPLKWLTCLRGKHFKFFFYATSIIFGLVHILNIKNINMNFIYFYPFFIVPQLIIGLFAGNIRMRKGFIWGFFLHSSINLTSFLFS